MADVMIEFQDTRKLHDVQEHALGYVGRDGIGQKWSYVQFREVVGVGERVRDSVHTDLITADDPGTVAADAAIGTDILEDTGKFPASSDLVGAIGAIVGGTGAGQNFTVIERIDNDKIRVRVITAPTAFNDREDGGWHTALDNTSMYELFFPGAVRQGDGATDIVRGITQVAVTANDLNRYGWVQQTGLGFQKIDATSANIPVIGEKLIPAADGLAIGYADTKEVAENAAAEVGRSLLGDFDGAADVLMWTEININNVMQSYRLPHATHPFAKSGQRIT